MTDQPGLFEIMYSMRALRRFKEDAVSNEVLFRLLGAAIHAPSRQNAQDWHFLAIRDRTIMRQLHDWAQIPWQHCAARYAKDPAHIDKLPRSQRPALRSVEHLVQNFAKVPLVILVMGMKGAFRVGCDSARAAHPGRTSRRWSLRSYHGVLVNC